MAELDLVVLGDCNPDLILSGDVEPTFGQVETLLDGADLTVGGSGAIVACGAARLGLRTALIGVVGDDLFGHFMRDSLAERGVDVGGCVITSERPTGVTVILARDSDRAMLTAPGSVGALTGANIDRDRLLGARHVHVSSFFLQLELQPDLEGLFSDVHDAGATTSVDPNWDPSGNWDGGLSALLEHTDCFFPNAIEACRIAGASSVEEAAVSLAEATSVVAIKDGANGGLARSGDEVARVGALTIDRVVDTTGAGDNFDAGFLAGRLLDWPLERCLALACACGSLSTQARGGIEGQPTMAEVNGLLDSGLN
jgi:sugar/nucleoside kinase (ribokinase family)